jgi:hypothetical protein
VLIFAVTIIFLPARLIELVPVAEIDPLTLKEPVAVLPATFN